MTKIPKNNQKINISTEHLPENSEPINIKAKSINEIKLTKDKDNCIFPEKIDTKAFMQGLTVEKSSDNSIKTDIIDTSIEITPNNYLNNSDLYKCAFDTSLTEEISLFDILCALGEVNNSDKNLNDKSEIFTENLRELRKLEILDKITDESGLQFNVYEKNNTVLIAINGFNSMDDIPTGARLVSDNNSWIDYASLGTIEIFQMIFKDKQLDAIENFYQKYKQKCEEENKNLIIAGYSMGGAITRYLSINHEDDDSTRFISFNALGTGRIEGKTIENYCIEGDGKSNGDGFYTEQASSQIFKSPNKDKHSLDSFMNVVDENAHEYEFPNNQNVTTTDKAKDLAINLVNQADFLNRMTGATLDLTDIFAVNNYLSLLNNRTKLLDESVEESYDNLPRTESGEIDINKISSSLKIVSDYIKNSNDIAKKLINYGVYKKNLDSPSIASLLLEPEIAKLLQEFIDIDGTAFDGIKFNSYIENNLNKCDDETGDILKLLLGQTLSREDIISNIANQNEELKKLCEMDLSTEDNLKEFLAKYKELTGTSFSCDAIENATTYIDFSQKSKIDDNIRAFGLSNNLQQAILNKTKCDILFGAQKNIAVNSLSTIPFVGAYIALLKCFVMNLAENGTSENDDEKIHITRKVIVDSLADTTVKGLVKNIKIPGNSITTGLIVNKAFDWTLPDWENDKNWLLDIFFPYSRFGRRNNS